MKKSVLIGIIVVIVVIVVIGIVAYSYVNKPKSESICAKAGEFHSNPSLGPSDKPVPCCEGLVSIQGASENQYENIAGKYLPPLGSGTICSNCGNGICENWEHKYNCAEDCKSGNYTCPTQKTIDCMPVVRDEVAKYCEPNYRAWITQNCNLTFTD